LIKKDNIFIFAKSYIKYLHEVLNKIDLNFFLEIEKEFLDLRKNNKTLYVIGNGGGAATAQAMANDLSFDIAKKTKVLKIFWSLINDTKKT
jgi:D-sedoheptulose 7-phosphate isomerase